MKNLISALFTLALVAFVGMNVQAQSAANPGDAITLAKNANGGSDVYVAPGKAATDDNVMAAIRTKGEATLGDGNGNVVGKITANRQDGTFTFTPSNSANPGDGNGRSRTKRNKR